MCQMCAVVVNTGNCGFVPAGPILATIIEVDDAPGSLPEGTPYGLRVGDSFIGTLGAGDADLVAIALTAGQTYRFDLGGTNARDMDTYLELYDPSGVRVAYDDDSGPGLASALVFDATTTGVFTLRVRGYNSSVTGEYQLAATGIVLPPVVSVDRLASYLTDGFWNDRGEARHAFDTSDGNVITVNVTDLTAEGRALALAAMDVWEMVANLDFRVVTTGGEIVFDDAFQGAYATYVASQGRTVSSFVNVDTAWLVRNGAAIGTYGFMTYVHEIGHALGLGHQGPYNGTGSFLVDARFGNDSWSMSVMSYFNQTENRLDPSGFAYLLTPMTADILAIQTLYGRPVGGATAGNTVWGEGSTLQNFLGDFFRAEFDGTPGAMDEVAFTLFDESGRDRVVFSTDTTDQSVRLEGEARWNVFGGTGNVLVARGTLVEDFVAGSGNDSVTGNRVGNALTGNGGNDTLSGMGGNDTLLGGAGQDSLSGGDGNDRLDAGDGNDRLLGGIGRDTLVGQTGRDFLSGEGGDDVLTGGLGIDTLDGGTGNDVMTGGLSADFFVFASGLDRITDFADNIDTLRIERDLMAATTATWNSLRALGQEFADRVEFRFSATDVLTVAGVTRLDQLADDFVFV